MASAPATPPPRCSCSAPARASRRASCPSAATSWSSSTRCRSRAGPTAPRPRFRRDSAAAIAQVRTIIRERGVDVVVGFGGYASAPAYVAARRERVPVVVHEANAKPGLANVLGARRAAGSRRRVRGDAAARCARRRDAAAPRGRGARPRGHAFRGGRVLRAGCRAPDPARLRRVARRAAPERGPRRLVARHPRRRMAAHPRHGRAVDARGPGRRPATRCGATSTAWTSRSPPPMRSSRGRARRP